MLRIIVVLSVCAVMLAGCSSGVTMSDYEALHEGMSISEAEDAIGQEMTVAGTELLLGSEITVGYFGDAEGPRIAIVAADGEVTRITPVGLD